LTGSQRGIALLLVLWILSVLMVIAMSFSFTTRTDGYSAMAFRAGVENRYLAEAGIERGIMEVVYRSLNMSQKVIMEGKEILKTDGRTYYGQMANGSYLFRVADESGKININVLTDDTGVVLKNLLIQSGVASETTDIIVDSILDWEDADDLRRLNGAESDYYLSLPVPYRAKDGSFETLEELLLVRGITPEILYGGDREKGIHRFLSLAPASTFAININVAPREVLMAIPGMTAEIADMVISDRESDDPAALKKMMDDIQAGLGPKYALVSPYLRTGDSNTYSIEATGYRESARQGYAIRTVVTFEGNRRYRYLYYKSPAEREP
jgi:general secretion pathway protein K